MLDRRLGRIIPAHAGQTAVLLLNLPSFPDHPRACGANHVARSYRWRACGSSPRMRGKPGRCETRHRHHRIIPAHAGQTASGVRPGNRSTDHPRACGANPIGNGLAALMGGSSPRMRGKHELEYVQHLQRRIIPAHAGQTPPNSRP